MFFREEDKIYIEVTLMSLKERICPNCNSRNVVIKDNETVKIKNSGSVKILNRKNCQLIINVIVIIHKKKYFCKDCKRTFSQQYDFSTKYKRISNDLARKIYEEFKTTKTFTEISIRFCLSVTAIEKLFDIMVKVERKPLTEILCFDEILFKVTSDNKYPCVISSFNEKRILDIAISRKNSYLLNYFKKISPIEKDKVKYCITDMFELYRKVIKKVFPKVTHIVDRFHVVKLFTTKINFIRAKLAKKDSLNEFDKKFLKKKWKLFLMDPTNIEIYEMYDECKNKYSTNKDIMIRIIYENLELYDIHYAYELFLRLRFGISRKFAEKKLDFIINILLNSGYAAVQNVDNSLLNRMKKF